MAELDKKETNKFPKELHFGDVFITPYNNINSRHVITDVGNGRVDKEGVPHFSAAEILNEKAGEETLALSGGHDIHDIGEIVDRWPLDKILSAYRRSFQGVLSDKQANEVLKHTVGYSKKSSRKIF